MVYLPRSLSPERREAARLRSWRDDAPTPATVAPMLRPITLENLAPVDTPRDCVVLYPALMPSAVLVCVYDHEGTMRVEMRMPRAWFSPSLEKWLLRFVRFYVGRRLQVVR